MKRTIQATSMLLCMALMSFSQDLIIGSPEEVYSAGFLSRQASCGSCSDLTGDLLPWIGNDGGWPSEWVADGVVCHLKKNDSTVITFWPSPNRIQRYEGTLTDLRNTYDPVTAVSSSKYHFGPPVWDSTLLYFENADTYFAANDKEVAIYLHNIYKAADGGLIGFTHNEIFERDTNTDSRQYSIGIAYSSNAGDTWTFCGEIIKTHLDDTGECYNMHGVPYLVIEDTFYVYFKEYVSSSDVRFCVAKASISDVENAAKSYTVSYWEKWNGGENWTSAISGNGVNILSARPMTWVSVDIHSDAIHLASTNNSPYILVTSAIKYDTIAGVTLDSSAILMFRSDDGLVWAPPTVVVEDTGQCLKYPFILAMQGASDDGHETRGDFYIYYHKHTLPPPGASSVLNFATIRQRVRLNNILPIINTLLLLD